MITGQEIEQSARALLPVGRTRFAKSGSFSHGEIRSENRRGSIAEVVVAVQVRTLRKYYSGGGLDAAPGGCPAGGAAAAPSCAEPVVVTVRAW